MIVEFRHDLPEPPDEGLRRVVAAAVVRVALPICYVHTDVGTAHENLQFIWVEGSQPCGIDDRP